MAIRKRTYFWDGEKHTIPIRDNQKGRLYKAERVLRGEHTLPIGDRDMESVIAFVRKVEASETWAELLRRSWKVRGVVLDVKDGRACRVARGGFNHLVLPRWARQVDVVLHEMAHAATPGTKHNWPFAAAFLMLVARFIGGDARDRLKASFKEHGV